MENDLRTERDQKMISDGGYLYTPHQPSADGTKKFWRCQESRRGCKARLWTDLEDVILKRVGRHTHGSDAAAVEVVKAKQAMKRRAVETMEQPSQILNNALEGIDQATQGKMPNYNATRKMIQRARNEQQMAHPAPTDLQSLVIPDAFQVYEPFPGQEERFLLGDTGSEDRDRILLFGRGSHQNWSHQMEEIFVDGTFSLSPPLFEQVYVMLAKRCGYVFPVLYALLPNKRRVTYDKLFQLIKEKWPLFNPTSIALDYETAVINSAREHFPTAQLHGCLFHLMKNLRRHLQQSGLLIRYDNEPLFALQARMIAALAFVPKDDLDEVFDALSEELPAELEPVLNWFEDHYLGRPQRNRGRRPALFPSEIWSVYERTINDQDRTNNHAEAAHRRLQTELDVDHPSLWKFIEGLRLVQKGRDLLYEQYVAGNMAPRKRMKYQLADQRILKIVSDYPNRLKIEYLRGLAHNFLME